MKDRTHINWTLAESSGNRKTLHCLVNLLCLKSTECFKSQSIFYISLHLKGRKERAFVMRFWKLSFPLNWLLSTFAVDTEKVLEVRISRYILERKGEIHCIPRNHTMQIWNSFDTVTLELENLLMSTLMKIYWKIKNIPKFGWTHFSCPIKVQEFSHSSLGWSTRPQLGAPEFPPEIYF